MSNQKHTPGQIAAKACMDYLMEQKSLACWRAEDVAALAQIIDQKTAAPDLLEALSALVNIFDPNSQAIYSFARREIEIARAAITKATP